MGEVYRARDPKLKRDVAIKVLPEATATDPDRCARLEREAQSLAADRVSQRNGELEDLRQREAAFGDQIAQGLAFDVFHRKAVEMSDVLMRTFAPRMAD